MTRTAWPQYRTLWVWLLLGWTVSAADRALTGPVVTWMIENKVAFLAGADKPFALGGLIGGLFFAGYMLTQWPGGYLGDRYGHRTMIAVSLVWAGIATLISGVITGLVLFIAIRVLTGLGEGAFLVGSGAKRRFVEFDPDHAGDAVHVGVVGQQCGFPAPGH